MRILGATTNLQLISETIKSATNLVFDDGVGHDGIVAGGGCRVSVDFVEQVLFFLAEERTEGLVSSEKELHDNCDECQVGVAIGDEGGTDRGGKTWWWGRNEWWGSG